MAKKKTKKPAPSSSSETHRVNMTFTLEEFAMLEEAAAKVMPLALAPTVMAKLLVMQALSGPSPKKRANPSASAPEASPGVAPLGEGDR
jgi:hypothetical protein